MNAPLLYNPAHCCTRALQAGASCKCPAPQARGCAEGIIAAVSLMSKSGLPCYGRGHPLENLQKRFHLEMSDAQAAAFMRATVHDAYDKVPSGFPHNFACDTLGFRGTPTSHASTCSVGFAYTLDATLSSQGRKCYNPSAPQAMPKGHCASEE